MVGREPGLAVIVTSQSERKSIESWQSRPLTEWQLALLFMLTMAPSLVSLSADAFHFDIDLKYSLIHWLKGICFPMVIAMPFYMNGGGFAKMALSRAFASTNSALVLLGLLPVVFSVVFAIIQLHGTDQIWLQYNPFYYPYDHEIHSYSGRMWYFVWGQQILAFLAFHWIAILCLSLTSARTRIGVIVATESVICLTALFSSRIHHIVDPKFFDTRVLHHSSNMTYRATEYMIECSAIIAMLLILERGFRPSLVAITTYFISIFIAQCFFESPTDLYGILARLFPLLIIWFVLRKANLGSEKWAEYQQRTILKQKY